MAITGCDVCSDACDNEPLCMSYECSAVQLLCNLNTQTWPDGYPSSNADYEDFAFCVKKLQHFENHIPVHALLARPPVRRR